MKVQNGTPRFHEQALCVSCRRAVHVRGETNSETYTYCHELDKELRHRVLECSAYDDKTKPSFYDMKKIAWLVNQDNAGKIGFVRPRDLTRDQRREIDELPDTND